MRKLKKICCGFSFAFGTATLLLALFLCFGQSAYATEATEGNQGITDERRQEASELTPPNNNPADRGNTNGISVSWNNDEGNLSGNIRILLVLTVISLAPAILIMLTSFTRIVVVLHFVRTAVGTQTVPPNQVMVGLALFLTLFIMAPVISDVNTNCVQPYQAGQITQEEALNAGLKPIREFMFEQTNRSDIKLFLDIEGEEREINSEEDIPTMVLMPAFMISELRTAFIIGFLIYLPFIIMDMVVASTLMSMGMMMLPPTTISMPFKILLFVLADGWDLVIGQLVRTFY